MSTISSKVSLSAHEHDCVRNRRCVIAFILASLLCRHDMIQSRPIQLQYGMTWDPALD